ncbi:MAG TPA: hypothetical protein VN549_09325 [Negativicutes bacterium]|nr:hypothetical protein [Negativicutes bacterium]
MDVFVARQPIFNKKKEVVAYELLYRKDNKNSFSPDTDGDHATSDVIINGLVLIGLDNLVGEKKAFINFTERLLLEKMPMLLPKEQLVIEVLENIEPTDEIVDACRELKAKGYIIALDDILKELPISEDIKLTLLGRDSAFSNIYGLDVAYEKADWNQVNRFTCEMKLDIAKIPDLYYEALNWADHIFMLERSV